MPLVIVFSLCVLNTSLCSFTLYYSVMLSSWQDIASDLDDGLHKINATVDCGNKLLPNCTPDSAETIKSQQAKLKADWDQLNNSVTESIRKLESELDKWRLYEECNTNIQRWLKEVEGDLRVGVEPKIELMEKKAQLEKFKVN